MLDVISEIRSAGINIETPSFDKIVRVSTRCKPRKKNGAYYLTNFAGQIVGWAKNYDEDINISFKFDQAISSKLTDQQKKELEKKRELLKQTIRAEELLAQKQAIKKAAERWSEYSEVGTSRYLDIKKVGNYGCRYNTEALVVPVRKNKELVGLQYITPEYKKFMTGTKKKGAYHKISGSEIYALCEGYATGASIHEATGWTVIICFDAGNLVAVAETFNKPRNYIICADNDKAGVENGNKAANILNCKVIKPDGYNDFNDIHMDKGIDATREQLIKTEDKTFHNFPEDCFPYEISEYVYQVCKSMDANPEIAYTTVLGLGSAISRNSVFHVKRSHTVRSNIYAVVVANAGQAKSPVMETILQPLDFIEDKLIKEYKKEIEEYKIEIQKVREYNKRKRKDDELLEEPNMPRKKTLLIDDGTMESIYSRLEDNVESEFSRFLMWYPDELSSMIKGLGQYKSGGNDLENLLKLHNYQRISINRANIADSKFIGKACISLIGNIQPDVADKHLADTGNGFAHRFIICMPDNKFSNYDVYADVEPMIKQNYIDYISAMDGGEFDYHLDIETKKHYDKKIKELEKYSRKFHCDAEPKFKTNFNKLILIMAYLWRHNDISIETIDRAYKLIIYYVSCYFKLDERNNNPEELKVQEYIREYLRKKPEGAKINQLLSSCYKIRKLNLKTKELKSILSTMQDITYITSYYRLVM